MIRERFRDDIMTIDADVPDVPKAIRMRGVHFRPHPSDPARVIREIWTGFGLCIETGSVHKAAEEHARVFGNAMLVAYERSQIQALG